LALSDQSVDVVVLAAFVLVAEGVVGGYELYRGVSTKLTTMVNRRAEKGRSTYPLKCLTIAVSVRAELQHQPPISPSNHLGRRSSVYSEPCVVILDGI